MVEITITRPIEIVEHLNRLLAEYPEDVKYALGQELHKVLEESKRLCPVSPGGGALRGSAHVVDPEYTDGQLRAVIGYSQSYAFWVHEIIDNWHEPPTQAKYLEVPLMAALPTITEKIIERVEYMISQKG